MHTGWGQIAGAGLVFVGGAVGSLSRYLLALALPGLWPVFVVNTVGSFALGLLLGRLAPHQRGARLLLGTGFLGGFTTYSAFTLDAVQLGLVGGPFLAIGFAAGSVAFGLVAALVGFAVAEARGVRASS